MVALAADEYVLLFYRCKDCDRSTSVGILGPSSVAYQLNCDESRRCVECQKKSMVRILRDSGCTIPDDRLLKMSIDGLLTLAGTPEGRK